MYLYIILFDYWMSLYNIYIYLQYWIIYRYIHINIYLSQNLFFHMFMQNLKSNRGRIPLPEFQKWNFLAAKDAPWNSAQHSWGSHGGENRARSFGRRKVLGALETGGTTRCCVLSAPILAPLSEDHRCLETNLSEIPINGPSEIPIISEIPINVYQRSKMKISEIPIMA